MGATPRAGTAQKPLHLVGAMRTHAGGVRHNNEDAIFFSIPEPGENRASAGALLLVADGMGGHAAGEIASAITVKHVRQVFQSSRESAPLLLARCFQDANRAVFQHGQDHAGAAGLGTTCTALIVQDGCVFLGHIGDSRAYLLREGSLRQLSTDHTLVGDLLRSGTITASEAAASPDRNVLLKALGVRPEIDPEIWQHGVPLQLDDRLVLCSDGLSDLVGDADICRLAGSQSPAEACDALLETALTGGGYDNISIGVFRIVQYNDASMKRKARPTRPTTSLRAVSPGWVARIRAFWVKLSQRGRRPGGRSRASFGGTP
jgi:protein phosphatase